MSEKRLGRERFILVFPGYFLCSRYVDRVFSEHRQVNYIRYFFVSAQHQHLGRATCFVRLFPASGAETPAISTLQAREAKLWRWSYQVIPLRLTELEKFLCYLHANRMRADILRTGFATPASGKASQRGRGANLQWFTIDISLLAHEYFLRDY